MDEEGATFGTSDDFDETGDPERLDAQILAVAAELGVVKPEDPDAVGVWAEYGRLRWIRYSQRRYGDGEPPDLFELDTVVKAFSTALARLPDDAGPDMEGWLAAALGEALEERHPLSSAAPDDLERALELTSRALRLLDVGSPAWFEVGENLAGLYLDRYNVTADAADVDSAIVALRQVLGTPGRAGAESGYARGQLGFAYAMRYDQLERPADRDEAIAAFAAALRHGHDSPAVLRSYADLLVDRAEDTGRDPDVLAALAALHRALADPHFPDEERAELDRYSFMGRFNRYMQARDLPGGGDLADLLSAVAHASAVLDNPAATIEVRDLALLVRAMARIEHMRVTDDVRADIEPVIADLEEVLPRADPELRPAAESLLAMGLLDRARQAPSPQVLDRAVRAADEALQRLAPGDPLRTEMSVTATWTSRSTT